MLIPVIVTDRRPDSISLYGTQPLLPMAIAERVGSNRSETKGVKKRGQRNSHEREREREGK